MRKLRVIKTYELGTTTTKTKCGNCPQLDGDPDRNAMFDVCDVFNKVPFGNRLEDCIKQEV